MAKERRQATGGGKIVEFPGANGAGAGEHGQGGPEDQDQESEQLTFIKTDRHTDGGAGAGAHTPPHPYLQRGWVTQREDDDPKPDAQKLYNDRLKESFLFHATTFLIQEGGSASSTKVWQYALQQMLRQDRMFITPQTAKDYLYYFDRVDGVVTL